MRVDPRGPENGSRKHWLRRCGRRGARRCRSGRRWGWLRVSRVLLTSPKLPGTRSRNCGMLTETPRRKGTGGAWEAQLPRPSSHRERWSRVGLPAGASLAGTRRVLLLVVLLGPLPRKAGSLSPDVPVQLCSSIQPSPRGGWPAFLLAPHLRPSCAAAAPLLCSRRSPHVSSALQAPPRRVSGAPLVLAGDGRWCGGTKLPRQQNFALWMRPWGGGKSRDAWSESQV